MGQQHFGKDLSGKTVAWVGDGNNVLHDLMFGSLKMGMNVQIATPTGYEPDADIMAKGKALSEENGVKEFDGYQVNKELMGKANDGAVFLHCLPRHIEEVTDEVIYSDASLVFPEAENRMWTVMAVMAAQIGRI